MAGRKKKILIICQHFWPESFRITDICDFLVDDGYYEIDVLCGIPNYPSGKFFDGYSYFKNRRQNYKSVRVERAFEIPRGNNTNFRIFINYISFPIASLFHIPRLLTRHYDKILLYQLSPVMMTIAGIIVGKLQRIETTMYVLDLWPENLFSVYDVRQRWLKSLVTWVAHWHYKHVDKLVALSQKMKTRLLEISAISEDKITILPQACEKVYETDIHDAPLQKRFSPGFNIVFTGNISPAQSFETIIAAAKQLHKSGLTDLHWIIVGDGMSRQWLEAEVKKAGLNDCFFFEGQKPITDIPRYTSFADVLIGCLVKSELLEATIPAKVMSYFAAGRPMVLAMDGEVQELINDAVRCGFAGPTEDAHVFAANLRKVYDLSPQQRHELGKRARKYHFKYFQRDIILRKLVDFMFGS